MALKGIRIGFCLTGSHCTLDEIMPQVGRLVDQGAILFPIISPSVNLTDTRFGSAQKWKDLLLELTGNKILTNIVEVEPIGPQKLLDVVVVAPCTGNTLAKIANGITDTAVLMAVKAHLRNQRPVVLAISTNDGLGINAANIGKIIATKNLFMVPFGQDNPQAKPNSLVADMTKISDTVEAALQGKQIQPVLIAG